ncbi:MAG: response regulator [Armatimonadota bacterium]|nr:response regulator [Armatimonadota bacterium]
MDDDPSARRLARDSLSLSGEQWDIWEADDGRSAIDLIRAVKPDVILLDITMPEIGGIPVCSEIKADPLTSRAEIVIVSARTESDFIAASIEAGASEYVTKPFQPADLVRRVRRVLRREPIEGDAELPEADETCPEAVR